MIKKWYILFGVIALLFSWSASSAAEYTYPTIVLDGRHLSIAVPAIDESGRTMVPVRALFEELGAQVSWDEGTQTVKISKADQEIKLTVGQNTAYVNEKAVKLDTPPVVLEGRILVPLRFVSEAIGADVTWNAEKNEINIQTTPPSSNEQSLSAIPGSNSQPGSVAGEPDNAVPTPLPLSASKPLVMNPQILYILIGLLVIAGAVGGVIYVKRSRKNTVNVQIETHDGINLGAANQLTGNYDRDDFEEADHQGETREEVERSEAPYLRATSDSASTVDVSLSEENITSAHPVITDYQPNPQDDRETVEAYYNQGIKMIQQQNWADARLALVYPSIGKYKDSEELGYYIEAQEQYDESKNPNAADPYWAAVMADFYCRKIPDDYDGMFKEEISELKTMCKSNLAVFMQNLPI